MLNNFVRFKKKICVWVINLNIYKKNNRKKYLYIFGYKYFLLCKEYNLLWCIIFKVLILVLLIKLIKKCYMI